MTKDITPPFPIPNQHNFRETLEVNIYYPDHIPRTVTETFDRTKHHLIQELDTPCWLCGTKEDREVHHYHVEWAFSEAVDWDIMKILHPDFDWSIFKEAKDFVDHEYNMMVLCQMHHRGKNAGIHFLPYPLWIAQKYLKKEFTFTRNQTTEHPDSDLELNQ